MGSSSKKGRTEMEVGEDGVAVITITNPPVNSMSRDVLQSLQENYEQALRRDDVKAVVLTGLKENFSGGGDLTTFVGESGKGNQQNIGYLSVDVLTDTFEAARKPSVAAIDGFAFGGGLEVAMVCHARISTSNAQLGLTELHFGLIPALGGAQRLPRLVGLSKALEMILMSKRIKGKEAHALGLVDDIASPDELVMTARRWALDILERRRPWVLSLYRNDKLEPIGEAREILKFERAQVQKQSPNLHHPLVCIDIIEEGIFSGPRAGLWKEVEAFPKIVASDTCKSLLNIFFAQRATSKVPGITDLGLLPRKINKIAILGGGLMGSGIATALILSKYPVILKEVNEKFLEAGIGRIKGEATRKGFYVYDDKRKSSPDPEVKKYIEKSRSIVGITADPKLMKSSDEDIVEMIFFPVVNEACRILAEGIAAKSSDLDIASVMGMGFPPYWGGVMFWADSYGSKYICSRLEAWTKTYGDFFKPCAYLAERAAQGTSLCGPAEQTKSRL